MQLSHPCYCVNDSKRETNLNRPCEDDLLSNLYVPASRLVGIELNPGPMNAKAASPGATLFNDGLRICFSLLLPKEILAASRCNRHWFHVLASSRNRVLTYHQRKENRSTISLASKFLSLFRTSDNNKSSSSSSQWSLTHLISELILIEDINMHSSEFSSSAMRQIVPDLIDNEENITSLVIRSWRLESSYIFLFGLPSQLTSLDINVYLRGDNFKMNPDRKCIPSHVNLHALMKTIADKYATTLRSLSLKHPSRRGGRPGELLVDYLSPCDYSPLTQFTHLTSLTLYSAGADDFTGQFHLFTICSTLKLLERLKIEYLRLVHPMALEQLRLPRLRILSFPGVRLWYEVMSILLAASPLISEFIQTPVFSSTSRIDVKMCTRFNQLQILKIFTQPSAGGEMDAQTDESTISKAISECHALIHLHFQNWGPIEAESWTTLSHGLTNLRCLSLEMLETDVLTPMIAAMNNHESANASLRTRLSHLSINHCSFSSTFFLHQLTYFTHLHQLTLIDTISSVDPHSIYSSFNASDFMPALSHISITGSGPIEIEWRSDGGVNSVRWKAMKQQDVRNRQKLHRIRTRSHLSSTLEPPAPRLIGIELNPGPLSLLQAQQLFNDGLIFIFSYLSDRECILSAAPVCRHWFSVASEMNRTFSLRCTQLKGRDNTTPSKSIDGSNFLTRLFSKQQQQHHLTRVDDLPSSPWSHAHRVSSLKIERIEWRKLARQSMSSYRSLTHLEIDHLDGGSTKLIILPPTLRFISLTFSTPPKQAVLSSLALLPHIESLTFMLNPLHPLDWSVLAPPSSSCLQSLTSLHLEVYGSMTNEFLNGWIQFRLPLLSSFTLCPSRHFTLEGFRILFSPLVISSSNLTRLSILHISMPITGDMICVLAESLPQLEYLETNYSAFDFHQATVRWEAKSSFASSPPSSSSSSSYLFPHLHTFIGYCHHATTDNDLIGLCRAFSPAHFTTIGISECLMSDSASGPANVNSNLSAWEMLVVAYPLLRHARIATMMKQSWVWDNLQSLAGTKQEPLLRDKLQTLTLDYCRVDIESLAETILNIFPQLTQLHLHNTVLQPFQAAQQIFQRHCPEVKVTITGKIEDAPFGWLM